MGKIFCVIKEPGQKARCTFVDNELKTFQRLVGGYIQQITINSSLVMLVNEDGKLLDMDPCFYIRFYGGNDYYFENSPYGVDPDAIFEDYIVGPAVFVGARGDAFCDLDLYDSIQLMDRLSKLGRRGRDKIRKTNGSRADEEGSGGGLESAEVQEHTGAEEKTDGR